MNWELDATPDSQHRIATIKAIDIRLYVSAAYDHFNKRRRVSTVAI